MYGAGSNPTAIMSFLTGHGGCRAGEILTVANVVYEAGAVYELPVTVRALAVTATVTLTVTVTHYPPLLVVRAPPSPITLSALDKLIDDEVRYLKLGTWEVVMSQSGHSGHQSFGRDSVDQL